jgi:hypothetical protein
MVVLAATIPFVIGSPATAVEPLWAGWTAFNTCEPLLTDDRPDITPAASSLAGSRVSLASTPGALQALPSTIPSWSYQGNQIAMHLGWSLSTGDLTGDGVEDLYVSAWGFSNGEEMEGAAFMFAGSPAGLSSSPFWILESNVAGAHLSSDGNLVDVNADGVNELLLGGILYTHNHEDEGVAALWSWTSSGAPCKAWWVVEGNEEDAYFGYETTQVGDVNGDGYGDVMIGWATYEGGLYGPGRAFVYSGSPTGLRRSPIWSAAGTPGSNDFLGIAGVAGDVNGDGFDDLMVGAPYYDHGQFDEGAAFLYLGSASGPSVSPVWSAEANQAITYFGSTLASGDVNGDGYADMIVGAYEYDYDQNNDGAIFIYHGSPAGLPATPSLVLHGPAAGFDLGGGPKAGNHFATGDVNADGFSDLLVGATLFSNGQLHEGAVFLYMGSSSGLSSTPAWSAEGGFSATQFGNDVALGDLNHDGLDDVVVAAFDWSEGQQQEGAVFVYLTQAPSAAAGRVSESEPLTVQALPGGDLHLAWGPSCVAGDSDYEIYEGTLGSFASHVPSACSTGGLRTHDLTPSPGDRYYLVVPRNAVREGSYGLSSDGLERPASASSCMPQAVVSSCPAP